MLFAFSFGQLFAQCSNTDYDLSECVGDTFAVSFSGNSIGSGHFSYQWQAGTSILSGQGTSTVQLLITQALPNPHPISCIRYDSVYNCTSTTGYSFWTPVFWGIIPVDTLPICPAPNQIDTLVFNYLPVAFGPAIWTCFGGTIIARSTGNASIVHDTLVVQWNGTGYQRLQSSLSEAVMWSNLPNCTDIQYFYPPGAAINIRGTATACDTTVVYGYATDLMSGYTANWSVSNGQILNGQGSDSITVRWFGSGQITLSKTSTNCSGVYTDSLYVHFSNGQFSLGPDIIACAPDTIMLVGPTSPGYSAFQWSTFSNSKDIGVGVSGQYSLRATTAGGCVFRDTINVTLVPDCVWPGDANADGVADGLDVLSLGVYAGTTGPLRSNASINWTGQPMADWGGALSGQADPKHSDCDGNGLVDINDTLAISQNFGLVHAKATGISANGDPLRIEMMSTNILSGDEFEFRVMLGDGQLPVDSVYGLSFGVEIFQSPVSNPRLLSADYSNCWFANSQVQIPFLHAIPNSADFDAVVVRTDQVEQVGLGEVARFRVQTDTLQSDTLLELYIRFTHATLVDSKLNRINLDLQGGSIWVFLPPIAVQPTLPALQFDMFPNPASDRLRIELPQEKLQAIDIIDLQGRVAMHADPIATHSTDLDVSQLPAGMYFIRVATKHQQGIKRLVIAH